MSNHRSRVAGAVGWRSDHRAHRARWMPATVISLLLVSGLGVEVAALPAGATMASAHRLAAPRALGAAHGAHPDSVGPESGYASLLSGALEAIGEDMFTGASREAGSQLFDWGLAALGLANNSQDSAAQLAAISAELQGIQDQLGSIDSALTQLNGEISQLNCDTYGIGLSSAVATINTDYQFYESEYGQEGAGWSQTPLTDITAIEEFVAQVTQEDYQGQSPLAATSTSLVGALDTIIDELVPSAGTSGALASCIAAAGGAPAAGTWGTTSYYDAEVLPIEEYWYAIEIDAIEMLSDAYDAKAWVDAGTPGTEAADVASDVCVTNGAAEVDCGYALNVITSTRQALYNQWQVGGAPYDSNSILTVLNGPGLVLPLSLTAFTQDADASCTAPLTSASPCGPTAGPYNMTSIAGTVEGATGWTAATAAQLEAILSPTSTYVSGSSQTNGYFGVWNTTEQSETPAAWLASQEGFQDLGASDDSDLVIGCPDTGSVTTVFENSYAQTEHATFQAACFIDLGVSYSQLNEFDNYEPTPSVTFPLFSPADSAYDQAQTGNYSDLSPIGPNGCQTNVPYWSSATADDGYFDAVFAVACNPPLSNGFVDTPGWVAGSSNDVYHWPVLDSSTVSCSNGASATNPAGVVSMCGSDLASYIDSFVPPLPSEVTFSSDAALGAPGASTSITGTVQIDDASGEPVATEVPIEVDLSAVSSTDPSESDDSAFFTAGGGTTSSVVIPAGASSATFSLGDSVDGDAPTVEASSFGLTGASQTEYFAGSATGLAFETASITTSATSDRVLGPVDVQFVDADGIPTQAPSSSTQIGVIYRCKGGCDFAYTSGGTAQGDGILVLPSATSSTTSYTLPRNDVYFSATTAGTVTISAEAVNTGLDPYPSSSNPWKESQGETVRSTDATSLVAYAGSARPGPNTHPRASVLRGQDLRIHIAAEDAFGNVARLSAPLFVRLTTSSSTGVFKRSGRKTVTVRIPAGRKVVVVTYVEPHRLGQETLQFASAGLQGGTLLVTVKKAF